MKLFKSEQRYIIFGGSSGIGRSVAILLNRLGASVICVGRNSEHLNNVKLSADFPNFLFTEQFDLEENFFSINDFMKDLKDKYGKFQGLVYSAGISPLLPLRSTDSKFLQSVFLLNYFSAIETIRSFSDRRFNTGKGCSIVAVASIAAISCEKGQSAYAGSKAALIASLKSIARELVSKQIRVNTVSPSIIHTRMLNEAPYEIIQENSYKYPLGFGKPEDVSNLIVFLLSDLSSMITGQNYIFDSAVY